MKNKNVRLISMSAVGFGVVGLGIAMAVSVSLHNKKRYEKLQDVVKKQLNQIDLLDKDKVNLQNKVNLLNQDRVNLQNKVNLLNQNRVKLENEISTLEQDKIDTQNLLKIEVDKNERNKKVIKDLQDQISQLKTTISDKNKVVKDLQDQISQLKTTISDKDKEISKLKKEIKDLKDSNKPVVSEPLFKYDTTKGTSFNRVGAGYLDRDSIFRIDNKNYFIGGGLRLENGIANFKQVIDADASYGLLVNNVLYVKNSKGWNILDTTNDKLVYLKWSKDIREIWNIYGVFYAENPTSHNIQELDITTGNWGKTLITTKERIYHIKRIDGVVYVISIDAGEMSLSKVVNTNLVNIPLDKDVRPDDITKINGVIYVLGSSALYTLDENQKPTKVSTFKTKIIFPSTGSSITAIDNHIIITRDKFDLQEYNPDNQTMERVGINSGYIQKVNGVYYVINERFIMHMIKNKPTSYTTEVNKIYS